MFLYIITLFHLDLLSITKYRPFNKFCEIFLIGQFAHRHTRNAGRHTRNATFIEIA